MRRLQAGEKPAVRRLLLITGSPRSGTRYTQRVWKQAGLDVQHEGLGQNGVSSGLLAVDDWWYFGGKHQDRLGSIRFRHRWHQVREPLATISSLCTLRNPEFWLWQERHTGVSGGLPDPEKQARFWLAWTDIADRLCDWVYRVEDLEELWPEMCDRVALRRVPLPEVSPQTGASKNKPGVGWGDLPSDLAEAIQKKAEQYGYRPEDA